LTITTQGDESSGSGGGSRQCGDAVGIYLTTGGEGMEEGGRTYCVSTTTTTMITPTPTLQWTSTAAANTTTTTTILASASTSTSVIFAATTTITITTTASIVFQRTHHHHHHYYYYHHHHYYYYYYYYLQDRLEGQCQYSYKCPNDGEDLIVDNITIDGIGHKGKDDDACYY